MGLTVLNVAYPWAPVGPSSVGGAEQVLTAIDRALVRAGHRSLVIACEGSVVGGELVATPRLPGTINDAAREQAWAFQRAAIARVLNGERVDVVHLHGIDFDAYLPPPGPPALVTLHLPPSWYTAQALAPERPRTFFHCVSAAQRAACPRGVSLLDDIPNGVSLAAFRPARRKRGYLMALGRICPEKGFHLALEAAARAGMPLILAGEVFRYEAHERYFEEHIAPRLDARRRFVGSLGMRRKRRLLAAATCLLVPSLVAETSSLVAMEAMASGTPVIALGNGALPEIVEHGRTGLIVRNMEHMAEACLNIGALDARECRRVAEQRFSEDAMTARYLARYESLASDSVRADDSVRAEPRYEQRALPFNPSVPA